MTNKLIIWDLDGVLLESRELHYEALNAALNRVGSKFVISREEHLSLYDGLNTTRKLDMLTERKGLPKSTHGQIWQDKQVATFDLIKKFPRDDRAIKVFHDLRGRGWKIAVCSNSIRETIKLALMAIGVMEYVDYVVSNEDVKRTKPFPEMYWQAMTALNALPKNTIIIEDSHIGRQGAIDSGAHLLAVENAYDWDYTKIFEEVEKMENKTVSKIAWRDSRLNVVIPAAGAGSRFANAGYTFPKPLIEVRGMSMLEMVCRNINIDANYIFIVQKEHYEKYGMESMLQNIKPGCKIVLVDGITRGAAETILLAREHINNDMGLFLANSDQFVEWDANQCMYAFKAESIDAGIITFNSSHPKWSYAVVNEQGFVDDVVEKKVVSNHATCGFYYWKKGEDFVKYADQMIAEDFRVNNEYYSAPALGFAARDGKKIRIKNADAMWGTGTPEDLDFFLTNYKGHI